MPDLRLSATGLEVGDDGSRLFAFADTVLRGSGQVMFQNNSYAGLLFLFGIACNSLVLASAALLGTISSTLAALALGADRQMVRSGMFGFNGGLVGIALAFVSCVGLSSLMHMPFLFNPGINLLSFCFSAAIGVVFGYFPARRAAQLDPIDALRHE